MKTLYLVSMGAQESIITAKCFGTCSKITVGAVQLLGGTFLPCKHDVCPAEADTLDVTDLAMPPTEYDRVVIRKLA